MKDKCECLNWDVWFSGVCKGPVRTDPVVPPKRSMVHACSRWHPLWKPSFLNTHLSFVVGPSVISTFSRPSLYLLFAIPWTVLLANDLVTSTSGLHQFKKLMKYLQCLLNCGVVEIVTNVPSRCVCLDTWSKRCYDGGCLVVLVGVAPGLTTSNVNQPLLGPFTGFETDLINID